MNANTLSSVSDGIASRDRRALFWACFTAIAATAAIFAVRGQAMRAMALNAGWVLVYTSLIMMILRFCAAPVVKWLTPLGLLVCSCLLAVAGLLALSKASGLAILGAATLYGVGKTYLWPTMLGIVAERFPKSGALSLNATSAVGMMSVGVMGTVFIGWVQDHAVENRLRTDKPALYQQVITTKGSVLGAYAAVDPEKVGSLSTEDQAAIENLSARASKEALTTIAMLPAVMLAGYIGLFAVFRRDGSYRVVVLADAKQLANRGDDTRKTGSGSLIEGSLR